MTPELTLVVVGADWTSLRRFNCAHVGPAELVLVSNAPRESLAAIANRHLDSARTPIVGIVHADCWFGPGALAEFTRTALVGAVCGIVGVDENGVYRWAGSNPGPVVTLDSCSVFLPREAGLWFDGRVFDGLHCHVEDLCMTARAQSVPVLVPSAQCEHTGQSNNAAPWRAEYQIYRDRLTTKWGGNVMTT